MIRSIAATEERRAAASIVLVEVTYEGGVDLGWEFTCSRCGDMNTMLTHADARELLTEHVCLSQCDACNLPTPRDELAGGTARDEGSFCEACTDGLEPGSPQHKARRAEIDAAYTQVSS